MTNKQIIESVISVLIKEFPWIILHESEVVATFRERRWSILFEDEESETGITNTGFTITDTLLNDMRFINLTSEEIINELVFIARKEFVR